VKGSFKVFKSSKKVKVAALSIASNTTLIILKIVAGILSGSVSIISEAIHSSMDLVASIIAFFAVRFSSKPADEEHPYGHGKIENVSGVIEGLLIFVAAFLIIMEAIKKLLEPDPSMDISFVAIGVMLFSAIANIFVSKVLYKVAKEEDSIALEADALHLKTDVYTSLGVSFGLILIKLTGIAILDPIVAILVAFLIIKESWTLCRNAFSPLIDTKLSDEEERKILVVMNKYKNEILDYHRLRTRKSGNIKLVDFHMTVNEELTVKESHALCENIENDLEEIIKNTSVNRGLLNLLELELPRMFILYF
jgi:cation diffusion facilitator family transporter